MLWIKAHSDMADTNYLPKLQPVDPEPYVDDDYAARARAAALRAYADAASKSFSERGELSSDLEDINQLEDFNYSPAALQYLRDYQAALTGYAGPYSLSSMDLNKDGPYTTSDLERYAAMGDPLSRMYANFNLSGQNDAWDVGNLQFAPNQNYRIVDRSTGEVLYSGKGYEAGEKISGIASGLFDSSGKMADWVIEQQGPEGGEWAQRYEHDPETSGFSDFLLAAAPFATMGLLSGLGVLGGATGAAGGAGGAAGSAALGQSLAAGAAGTGLGAGAVGGGLAGAAGGLGAGTMAGLGAAGLGALAPIKVVGAPAAGGIGAGTPAGIGTGIASGIGAASGIGGTASNAAATQAVPDEIVVTGSNVVPGGVPVDILGGTLGTIAGGVAGIPANAITPTTGGGGGGLSTLDYVRLGLIAPSVIGGIADALGGGGGGTLPVDNSAVQYSPLSRQQTIRSANDAPFDVFTYGQAAPGAQSGEFAFFQPAAPSAVKLKEGGEADDDMVKHLVEYSSGRGHMGPGQVKGIGSGQEDLIPAWLSDGEYVWSAQDVADLGDGSTDEGVRRLDKMRQMVRKQAGRKDTKKIAKPQRGIEHMLKAVGGAA